MNVNFWIIVLKKSFNEIKKNVYNCKYEWKDVKRYYYMSIEKLFLL